MRKIISFIFILNFAYQFLCAQGGEIVFTRITMENGLASSWINSVLQDHEGFYWFGSKNGLQRFDGNRMITYRHDTEDSASLPDNDVRNLMEDNKKRLWMCAGGYPCIFNPLQRNFKKIPVDYTGKRALFIYSLFQDSKGLIWMVTGADGLFVLDTIKNIFRSYTTIWPDFFSEAFSMVEDKHTGRYWLATDTGKLMYDPKLKKYYHKKNNPEMLECFMDSVFCENRASFYLDNNNVLWTHTKSWMNENELNYYYYRYDINKNSLIRIDNQGKAFYGFLTDASGTTWGYGAGLSHYDEKLNRFLAVAKQKNTLNGIDFTILFNMYEDAERNLWAMTDKSLYSFNPSRQIFKTEALYSVLLDKNAGSITTFVETNDGHIIALGVEGDGLYFYDSAFNKISPLYGYNPKQFKDENHLIPWCGLQDSKGLIWIGCQNGRITQLNPPTKKVSTLHPQEFGNNNDIITMTEDRNENIWFGLRNKSTREHIIVKWDRTVNSYKSIALLSTSQFAGGGRVFRILPGYNNDLWIATLTDGLIHFDLATEKVMETFLPGNENKEGSGKNIIYDMAMLNPDTLALGTGSGIELFHLKKKLFTHIGQKDGLPSGGVFNISNDSKNNLWITTLEGISKISLHDRRIHTYKSRDGVTEESFVNHSVQRFSNNAIAIGTPNGFVNFNPGKINESYVPADVLVTGFRIFNRSISVDSLFEKGNHISLSYSQNYITIQFASLSNVMNNRPQYYYMLEGFDKEWKKSSSNQEAIYTYLSGGHYTFKVKCVTNEGVESKNITSFSIYIKPPFYRTWWFYTLCTLLAVGIIYTIYRIRIQRLMALEKVRARIASDLHDDMGSALSTINILSTMAKTKVAYDPITTSDYISKISENSSTMMEAMSDIVWSINPLNDSMQKIVTRMREFAATVLEPKNIDYDFYVDEKVLNIKTGLEEKKDLFLIFKEAVNNLAKYSGCKKAWIELKTDNKKLLLLIKDDGKGFDVSSADNGNGMHNMRKRAAALKGNITIESSIGKGTEVTLNMPLS